MECTLCNKQHVAKAETAFNIRLNNHRKGKKDQNAILSCRHFQQQGHNFNSHAKSIVIDKLVNTSSSKDILRKRLIQRENLWISVRTASRTQQIENENIRAIFSRSFLPRPQQHVTLELR